jgi:hypothetical protein
VETEIDYEGLRQAVAGEDSSTVSKMLSSQPDIVLLSVARSAVQVLDCTGAVVMHLPVSRAFTERVQAAF